MRLRRPAAPWVHCDLRGPAVTMVATACRIPRDDQRLRHAAGLRHRQIAVRDTTLHVAEVGDGPAGPAAAWLAGVLDDLAAADEPAARGFSPDRARSARLRRQREGARPAQPMSAPTAMPTTWPRCSTRSGSKAVGVVGHDVGAYVAQAMARRHPRLVDRLLFFNCPTACVAGRWVHDGHVNEVWYQAFQQLPLAEQLIGSSREACALYIALFPQPLVPPQGGVRAGLRRSGSTTS